MTHKQKAKTYTRRDSMRLRGFDYTARQIYFVTIVADQRRYVFLNIEIARAVIGCLMELRQKIGCHLYCYCLMPDHMHILIGPGDSKSTLGQICGSFKSLSTRAYWQWGEGRLWQRQYFDHIIQNEKDFFESLEYIKLNPVRKGLVKTPDEWPFTGSPDELQ